MLHACGVRFDVTENLENFLDFEVNKTSPSERIGGEPPDQRGRGRCSGMAVLGRYVNTGHVQMSDSGHSARSAERNGRRDGTLMCFFVVLELIATVRSFNSKQC